jgi:predicted nucleotidyltransferase
MDLIIQNVSKSRQAPPLLPIFRSEHQLRLLAYLFLHPDRDYSLTELAQATRVPQPTISRETQRLLKAGVLSSESVGRTKLVRPNQEAPYFEELQGLLLKLVGPLPVLEELLDGIPGVEAAYIYGSWARRYLGEPGKPPRDLDVVVVGRPELEAIYSAVQEAEDDLGLEINPTVFSRQEWDAAESAFLATVRQGPLVPVVERG